MSKQLKSLEEISLWSVRPKGTCVHTLALLDAIAVETDAEQRERGT